MFELANQLSRCQSWVSTGRFGQPIRIRLKDNTHLQPNSQTFQQSYAQMSLLFAAGFYRQKQAMLRTEIRDIQ